MLGPWLRDEPFWHRPRDALRSPPDLAGMSLLDIAKQSRA
jgi:hypothetical protein